MENFFELISSFVKVIADFLQRLFVWKKGDFDDASNAVSEYVSVKESEKETQGE